MAKHSPFSASSSSTFSSSSHPKGTFTSFINGHDITPNGFKSYVDFSDNDTSFNEESEDMPVYIDCNLKPILLPGEEIVSSLERVLKFNSFMNYKQGVSGDLHLTNYKLAFVTSTKLNDTPEYLIANTVDSANEIPFTNIDSVYPVEDTTESSLSDALIDASSLTHVLFKSTKDFINSFFSQGRKKKLSTVTSVQQPCKRLMIYSRDFKIHSFGFKMVGNNERIIQFLKQISEYAFPDQNKLFILNYDLQKKNNEELSAEPTIPMFIQQKDWNNELMRIDKNPDWYVTSANENFQLSHSLPKYFIVPNSLAQKSFTDLSMAFDDKRLLSWSYSSTAGTTLTRMPSMKTGINNFTKNEEILINAVKQSSHTEVSVFDLTQCCPTVKDIGVSGEKLKELCMTDCMKDFWSKDTNWLSYLEDTKWLNCVQRCLGQALNIVEEMTKKEVSVILKEPRSRDVSCLLSCLVQLLLDPHYRTILGFQSLIQREWVSMGHPFPDRCGFVSVPGAESPVFLLFLDCVWQLTIQFPIQFEFTETYLTVLWDSLHTGLFGTFLFNCQYQHCDNSATGDISEPWLSSVWKMLANASNKTLFYNPLYIIYNNHVCCDFAHSVTEAPHESTMDQILYPQVSLIKLWTQCYIRWLHPGQINGGGKISGYLQQCLLVEEILTLQNQINSLSKGESCKTSSPDSNLVFGTSLTDIKSKITSSFPFSNCYKDGVYANHSSFPHLSLNLYKRSSQIILSNINVNTSERSSDLQQQHCD